MDLVLNLQIISEDETLPSPPLHQHKHIITSPLMKTKVEDKV